MRCIATRARVRWALLRSTLPVEVRKVWLSQHAAAGLTMNDARELALAAGVPVAALLAPDPGPLGLFAAWLTGLGRRFEMRLRTWS